MGTTIEFRRVAVAFEAPVDRRDYTRTNYMVAAEIGADNTFDRDGKIARQWNFFHIGRESEIIKELARTLSDVEDGMLRYQNGRTKPENYLKNWRSTIRDETISIERFNEECPSAQLVLSNIHDPEENNDKRWESITTVTNEWDKLEPDKKEHPVYKGDVTAENLILFNDLKDLALLTVEFNTSHVRF